MTIDEERTTTQDYRLNHGIHLHFVNNPPSMLASSQVKSMFTLSQETHNILNSKVFAVQWHFLLLIFDLMVMTYIRCYILEGYCCCQYRMPSETLGSS
jgi:hypothetical protein